MKPPKLSVVGGPPPPPDNRFLIVVRNDNLMDVVACAIVALKMMKPEIRRGNGHLVRTYQNEDGELVTVRVKGAWLKYHLSGIIRFERDGEPINQPGIITHLLASFREFPYPS